MSFSLTRYSLWRTERRRGDLNGFQYRGKHGPGLLPEKPLRGCGPVRALEQEVVDGRQAFTLAGVVEAPQLVVAKRQVTVSPFYIGAGALEHLREPCRLVLEPLLLSGGQLTQRSTGLKQRQSDAISKVTKRLAFEDGLGGGDMLKIVRCLSIG